MRLWILSISMAFSLLPVVGNAQEFLTRASASFIFDGNRVTIGRDNDRAAHFAALFAQADRSCGNACIAPMRVGPGVVTYDETEVLDFLTNDVAGNTGLMVDARLPAARDAGFIPGSVSLPHQTVAEDNDFRGDVLRALGARELEGIYNFADARDLLVYDVGPVSDDAARLVANLLAAGYPARKIRYYRGGMQMWSVLGFSIEESHS